MRQLTDRVAMVTGAGSGIGRALALELAGRGCHVAVTDRTAEPLDEVVASIRAMGRVGSAHAFDVSDREAWPEAVEAVRAAHGGRIHLLVNNAGVALTGPFLSCSLRDHEWQLDVNLRGVLYGCHHVLPVLLEQDEGHLVNVSSLFGIVSMPDNAAYCMSKHAVKALTEALHLELVDSNVRFTSVHPGAVATRIVVDGRFREGGAMSESRARETIAAGVSPEQAARTIADGVQGNALRVMVGRDAQVMATLRRLIPRTQMRLLGWWFRRARRRQSAGQAAPRG